MTRSATAWAALKAMLGAFVLAIALALVFGGISELGQWLASPLCLRGFRGVCNIARFWTAHWFYYYVWLYEPIQLLLLLLLIRRFAAQGYRLQAVGFVCVFEGSLMLLGVAIPPIDYDLQNALYLAGGALLLSLGLFLWLRQARNTPTSVGA